MNFLKFQYAKRIFLPILLIGLMNTQVWGQSRIYDRDVIAPQTDNDVQPPPSENELQQIKKIADAIKTGEARNLDWWKNEYGLALPPLSPVLIFDSTKKFNQLLDRNYKQLRQCPSYVHDGIRYGCIEALNNHLEMEFESFLDQSNVDLNSPIRWDKSLFGFGDGGFAFAKTSSLSIGKYTAVTQNHKITLLSIALRRHELGGVESKAKLADFENGKMPAFNLEKFPLEQSDAFALVETSNGTYRYFKPCLMNSILKQECMPAGGVIHFEYFFYGE